MTIATTSDFSTGISTSNLILTLHANTRTAARRALSGSSPTTVQQYSLDLDSSNVTIGPRQDIAGHAKEYNKKTRIFEGRSRSHEQKSAVYDLAGSGSNGLG
jgi:hypothetical protein